MIEVPSSFSKVFSDVVINSFNLFKPPPNTSMKEWAETNFRLPESSAKPGKLKLLPYQVGILETVKDPKVKRTNVMKPAQAGWSPILTIAAA